MSAPRRHPIGRRPRRRHHGRADRRAPRERGRAGAAARPHRATSRARASSAPRRSSRIRSSRATPPRSSTRGGFDHGSRPRSRRVDWIIEAVVEQLDVKRALLERVDAVRRRRRRSSRRTRRASRSASLAEGRSDGFRRHWLGTHFFNPPRYLHLLEVIPTAGHRPDRRRARRRTSPIVASARASSREGHARTSSPTTSACYGVAATLRRARVRAIHDRRDRRDHRTGDRPAEERDVPHDGHRRPRRPRARSRRTSPQRLPDAARSAFTLPAFLRAGRARLARREGRPGVLPEDERQRRHPRRSIRRPSTTARGSRPVCRRSRRHAPIERRSASGSETLFLGQRQGRARSCARRSARRCSTRPRSRRRSPTRSTTSTARCEWGFGWELGPFEIWDAIGVATRRSRPHCGVASPPPLVAARSSWREAAIGSADGPVPPAPARTCRFLSAAQDRRRRRPPQRRREPRRSGRRRAGRRVPLEDERDRRRHDADAAAPASREAARTSPRSSSATTRRTSRPAPT